MRLLVLAAACVAAATQIAASPLHATFTGENGVQAFGYYVSPYYGTLDGTPVIFFCDDFANEVTIGQSWLAKASTITPGSDLSQTRYGKTEDAIALYEQAAWLTAQFDTEPKSQYGDLQASIWQIFDANAPEPSTKIWINRAKDSYTSMSYANYRVITNTGPVKATGQVQEFIMRESVPEPAAFVLFGSGLLCMMVFLKSRRRFIS